MCGCKARCLRRIAFIVDVSESQRAFLREHQTTVDAFLARLLRPGDRAFAIAVNEEVVLQSEYIGRPSGVGQILLARGGEPMGFPCSTIGGRHLCGGTALWNAVYAAAHFKLSQASGAKALLILSDGGDTGSIHPVDEALHAVQRAGAILYAIRYSDPLQDSGVDWLSRLATETGGVEFPPPMGNYATALDQMQRDLRSQYVLTFRPDAHRGGMHSLRVEAARSGLLVRSRRQYVAPGQ